MSHIIYIFVYVMSELYFYYRYYWYIIKTNKHEFNKQV